MPALSDRGRGVLAGVLALVGVLLIGEVAVGALGSIPPPGNAIQRTEDAVALGILEQEVLDTLRANGEVESYVVLNIDALVGDFDTVGLDPAERAEVLDRLETALVAAKDSLLTELGTGARLITDFGIIPTLKVEFLTEDALLAAVQFPEVAVVHMPFTGDVHLEESIDLVHARQAQAEGFGGAGTYVAVFDTGVDAARYPEYFTTGRVAESFAADDSDGSALRHGHGTHVASTVLAVAPETTILPVDVFVWTPGRKGPNWSNARISAGLEHVVDLKRKFLADASQCCNIVALNMSLGRGLTYEVEACVDEMGLRLAYAAGIVPVVATGNDAEPNETKTFRTGISEPACTSSSLGVGATTDGVFPIVGTSCDASSAADEVTWFSQTGPLLDIVAPGSCIVAAGGAKQGTSMAAPHVAGAVAALVSARPSATIDEVWKALTSSGPVVSDPRTTPPTESHRLDVAASAATLLAGTIDPGVPAIPDAPRVVIAPTTVEASGAVSAGDGQDLSPLLAYNAGNAALTYTMVVQRADPGLAVPASWIAFQPSDGVLGPGETRSVAMRLQVPPGTAAGTYAAVVGPAAVDGSDQPAGALVSFTVVEPLVAGGWVSWSIATLLGSTLTHLAFGGVLLVGAFRLLHGTSRSGLQSA